MDSFAKEVVTQIMHERNPDYHNRWGRVFYTLFVPASELPDKGIMNREIVKAINQSIQRIEAAASKQWVEREVPITKMYGFKDRPEYSKTTVHLDLDRVEIGSFEAGEVVVKVFFDVAWS